MKITENGIFKFRDISECGITEGLVGWYPLNGDALDKSSYGNDGVINGATVAQGLGQLCYEFDGIDDIIICNNTSQYNLTNITISFWCCLKESATKEIIYKPNAFEVFQAGLSFKFRLFKGEGDLTFGINTTLNTWTHIVTTFDGIIKKTYINAVSGNSHTCTGINVNSNNITFGRYETGSNMYPFKGLLQDVRIYNKALTPEEVKILYDTTGVNTPMKIDENGKIYIKNLKEV